MFKEKAKTLIIILLLINALFLTYHAWFQSGVLGSDWRMFSFSELPFARLFSHNDTVSVPKENLSKPRKIVVNDGELWVPYYNTDEAFGNLNENTSVILKALLQGRIKENVSISYAQWLERLTDISVYVEYPVTLTPKMLSKVLNTSYEKLYTDITAIKDAIIIPNTETSVYVAVRDAKTNIAHEFLIEDEEISFPREVLAMYTDKYARDGYYEFAFSTLLGEGLGEGKVKVSDLVLFSDNESVYRDIIASNPIYGKSHENILQSFSFNPRPLRHYSDEYGAVNYVENYATVTVFPDGYIEYSAVDEEKGILLSRYENDQYELLNSVIDFAEKVWSNVSDKQLNVLVAGVEETDNSNKFIFDYYCGGREIATAVEKEGREGLYHAIEIVAKNGRIVSYRQYLREYEEALTAANQENFMVALDYFVELFKDTDETVITDLCPGYFDGNDGSDTLRCTWLCEINGQDKKYPKR